MLAVDRNNPQVANLYDALHPAVLSAIKQIVVGAHEHGKPVSVCGEMASDPAAAIVLLGMGVDSLSMSNSSILKVKWVIRNFSFQYAQEIVNEVLAMENAKTVRHYLDSIMEEAGLGGLLRPGK